MKIKLIDGNYADVRMETPAVRAHFVDPYNYTDAILDQFEHSIYHEYLTADDKIILDIGANIGLFALHVSPYAEKIICVEPTPSHMAKQQEILKGLPVTHVEAALSNKVGEQDFHWCGINTTMNSLQDRHSGIKFKVKTTTLQELIRLVPGNIDFCKIDIEGSEWQAITYDTLAVASAFIKKIFIELHPPNQHSQDYFKKIFEAVGYKVEVIIHDTLFCYR